MAKDNSISVFQGLRVTVTWFIDFVSGKCFVEQEWRGIYLVALRPLIKKTQSLYDWQLCDGPKMCSSGHRFKPAFFRVYWINHSPA